MSLSTPILRHLPLRHLHSSCITPLRPIASSSRLPLRAISSSPLRLSPTTSPSNSLGGSTRHAHALAQASPEPSGFEGVPAPAYNGPVETSAVEGKGKAKETTPPPTSPAPAKESPKRKMTIKSQKAAISMTPQAIAHLRSLLSSPTEPKLLRIGVKTRGCAGMAYHLEYVSPPGGRFDEVVEQDGVKVLIDSKALFSIIGSKMDWRDNRLSAGFVFDNPNIEDTCGCGESFNIRP